MPIKLCCHGDQYRCPNCGRCLRCEHEVIKVGPGPGWRCWDGREVDFSMLTRIIEERMAHV